MKKGLKGIISTFIILIFAGFVFYLGFVSYKVPQGKIGVLVSKTGGTYPKIIKNGEFIWKWECVIPKNTELYVFSKTDYVSNQKFSGALPSADIYSSLIKGSPDFSYSFDFDIHLGIEEDFLLKLVERGEALGQSELNAWFERKAESISREISQVLIGMNEDTVIASYNVPEILKDIKLEEQFPDVKIRDVYVNKASVPDLRLYKMAQSSYDSFQSLLDEKIAEKAQELADSFVADERSVKKLTKIGEMLKEYPELNALLSNGSTADVLKALNEYF